MLRGNNRNGLELNLLLKAFSTTDDFKRYVKYKPRNHSLHTFKDTILVKPVVRCGHHYAELLKFVPQGGHLPLLYGIQSIIDDPHSACRLFQHMHGPVYTSHFVQVQGLLIYRNIVRKTDNTSHAHNRIQGVSPGDHVFHDLEGVQAYPLITPGDLRSHQIVTQIISSAPD